MPIRRWRGGEKVGREWSVGRGWDGEHSAAEVLPAEVWDAVLRCVNGEGDLLAAMFACRLFCELLLSRNDRPVVLTPRNHKMLMELLNRSRVPVQVCVRVCACVCVSDLIVTVFFCLCFENVL